MFMGKVRSNDWEPNDDESQGEAETSVESTPTVDPTRKKRRSVTFGAVYVQEYNLTIGDHPCFVVVVVVVVVFIASIFLCRRRPDRGTSPQTDLSNPLGTTAFLLHGPYRDGYDTDDDDVDVEQESILPHEDDESAVSTEANLDMAMQELVLAFSQLALRQLAPLASQAQCNYKDSVISASLYMCSDRSSVSHGA
jgi:hypothetical protein